MMAKQTKTQMLPTEWRASTSLAGVYALRMLGMFLVLPVLALHARELPGAAAGEEMKMVGYAMAAYAMTQALFQLPLGMASDKFGRKKVIYAGMLLFAIGSLMATFAESVQMLILARAIQGAGAVSAAVTALLADLTREEVRTRAMSMIGLSIGITFSLSLILSPILTQWVGVNGLFAIMSALTLASIAVVAKITPAEPRQHRLHQDTQTQWRRMGEVLQNTRLLNLNFGIFTLQTCLMAMFATLPFALHNLGLEKTQHWIIYLPATIIGLILMIPAIIIGETRNKLKPVFLLGIILTALAQFALIASIHSTWLIAVCLIIYFIGFNILEASLPSLVSKIAPSDLKGTAMGVYNTLQSVGLLVGGICGALIYDAYGHYGVLIFCTVLTLVWLMFASISPAPKPVRNLMFAISDAEELQLEKWKSEIIAIEGVEEIHISADKKTIFVKVLQQNCDENKIKTIITGV